MVWPVRGRIEEDEGRRTMEVGGRVRELRAAHGMSQDDLAARVYVSRQTVSSWESGRGLPDISLVEGLAGALGVSVAELLTGEVRENANRAGNLLRTKSYVCPICGNVVTALGEGAFSCCGSQLMPQDAEDAPEEGPHAIKVERIEDEWYVTLDHPMTKNHFVSFIAYVTMDGMQLRKLYPEQSAEARFHIGSSGYLYVFCNRHGLFRVRTPRRR